MSELMLTTIDNPYNPFTEFNEWFAFDVEQGYTSCGLLARFTISSIELSEQDQEIDLNQGLRDVLRLFPLQYRLVDKNNIPQVLEE